MRTSTVTCLVAALAASTARAQTPHRGEISRGVAFGRSGQLDLRGGPAGAEVVVDGVVVGRLPLDVPLRAPAGSLTFTVRREGFIPETRTVRIDGGSPLREQVTLSAMPILVTALDPVAPTAERADAWRPPPRRRTSAVQYVGYALIGSGVAAIAVSGVFLIVNRIAVDATGSATPSSAEPYAAWARFQASENASRQSGSGQCDLARQRTSADAAQVRDLCSRIATSATGSLVAGLAGASLLVTGLVFAVVGRPSTFTGAGRWSLSPWIAADTTGAYLSGRW